MNADSNRHRAAMHLDNRRVPVGRLIRKLGLSDYRNVGPLLDTSVHPQRVRVPLQQHIGAPAAAVVRVGDRVQLGDVLARPAKGKLGAVVHASITGTIAEVSDAVVIGA